MLLRLLITVVLAATPTFAQRGGGSRGGGDAGLTDAGPAVSNRLDIITQVLQLDKEQKKFVKTTFDHAQSESAPVRERLTRSHEAIGEAVRDGKSPEEMDGLIKNHAAVAAQMARIEMEAFAQVFLKLDQAQQDKSRSLFQMMKGIFSAKNWNEIQ